jgi:hypothetical protein
LKGIGAEVAQVVIEVLEGRCQHDRLDPDAHRAPAELLRSALPVAPPT